MKNIYLDNAATTSILPEVINTITESMTYYYGNPSSIHQIGRKAKSLVEKKVSLPAYDQCLKASHTFNILDARGVIGVAQRAGYIGRIRDITKAVAESWLSSQTE